MQRMRDTRHHWSGRFTSKRIESLRSYGIPLFLPSKIGITKLPPTKKPKWKIGKGRKLPRDPNKGWNGNQDCSEKSEVDPVDQKKVKRTWIGSSTQ